MKKIIFILSALLVCTATAFAQDVITKKNGEDIKAKVLEIDNTNVKYKLFDEPNGVIYTIPKFQILVIRYESGRNEIFNTVSVPLSRNVANDREPIDGLRAGMKYKELKNIYDYIDWRSGFGDRYNPAVMGVCSWLIPGLGQMISGEVGRGLGWLGGTLGCSVIIGVGGGLSALAYGEDEGLGIAGFVLSLTGSLAMVAVDICAIVDACRVAKVKNMYEQDLKKMNYSLELHPSVDYIRMANKVQTTAGFTLAMKF